MIFISFYMKMFQVFYTILQKRIADTLWPLVWYKIFKGKHNLSTRLKSWWGPALSLFWQLSQKDVLLLKPKNNMHIFLYLSHPCNMVQSKILLNITHFYKMLGCYRVKYVKTYKYKDVSKLISSMLFLTWTLSHIYSPLLINTVYSYTRVYL